MKNPQIFSDRCYYLFFLLGHPPWPHIILIVVWWSSKPRTEAIGTLNSVPLLCYIGYLLPPAFRSCTSSPPAPPPLCTFLPHCPSPLPTSTSTPLVQSPPVTITSKEPRLPASKPIAHRGPESVASQYIPRPYSDSFGCRPRSLQIPPPP